MSIGIAAGGALETGARVNGPWFEWQGLGVANMLKLDLLLNVGANVTTNVGQSKVREFSWELHRTAEIRLSHARHNESNAVFHVAPGVSLVKVRVDFRQRYIAMWGWRVGHHDKVCTDVRDRVVGQRRKKPGDKPREARARLVAAEGFTLRN